MTSARQRVWLITGASSSLGYRMCLAVLARGELVVASAAFQQDLDRLRTAGACGVNMDSEMSFGQIKSKIREVVSFYGRIDFVINNPEYEALGILGEYGPSDAYQTNAFSYAAIQVTQAVAQECSIRQIVMITSETEPGHPRQAACSSDMRDNVEATALLFATEYRSRRVKVLLAKPRCLYVPSMSRKSDDDMRAIVERIVEKVREGGPSEPGLRVM